MGERSTGDRRGTHEASLRSLARKVDALTTEISEDRKATDHNTRRIDNLNLNGSAPALKRLADNADQLLELARVAPTIIAAVERDADMAAFWRVTKHGLNPLKPIGALVWALVISAATAIVWNLITTNHALIHH